MVIFLPPGSAGFGEEDAASSRHDVANERWSRQAQVAGEVDDVSQFRRPVPVKRIRRLRKSESSSLLSSGAAGSADVLEIPREHQAIDSNFSSLAAASTVEAARVGAAPRGGASSIALRTAAAAGKVLWVTVGDDAQPGSQFQFIVDGQTCVRAAQARACVRACACARVCAYFLCKAWWVRDLQTDRCCTRVRRRGVRALRLSLVVARSPQVPCSHTAQHTAVPVRDGPQGFQGHAPASSSTSTNSSTSGGGEFRLGCG